MNIYQRIVLIVGAIALVISIWTTPKFVVIEGSHFKSTSELSESFIPKADTGQIIARSAGVLGVTFLVYFALKGIGNK